jgi:hypothetical protein
MKDNIENKCNKKYKIKIEKRDIKIKILKKEMLVLQSENMLSHEIILKLESILRLEINSISNQTKKSVQIEGDIFKDKYLLLQKEFIKLEEKIKILEKQNLDSDLENQSDESEIDV